MGTAMKGNSGTPQSPGSTNTPSASRFAAPKAPQTAGSISGIGESSEAISTLARHTGITVKHNSARPKGL